MTWLSPGTRKKSGASGANGNRNLLSNTAWATSALSNSERGTVVTSVWLIFPSASASLWEIHPAILSMNRIESLESAVNPTPAVPGLTSTVAPLAKPGTFTGAALMYATTMLRASPAGSESGPDAWMKRASPWIWPRKQ